MELEARFDSPEMKRQRKLLAEQMPYDLDIHNEISDAVFELFESIAIAYNRGYLHQDLASASFSYHAVGWWKLGEKYVQTERAKLTVSNV